MASIIHTAKSIQSVTEKYRQFGGLRHNSLSGTADYGNTSASWSTSGTDKLSHSMGEDPAYESLRWTSQSRYAGWMNTRIGVTDSRYLTGDFISGCSFRWITWPNEDGGIALRRWGVQICKDGSHKRWSSAEVSNWSTSKSWKTISLDFSGDLLSQLNRGWQFEELHLMVHTPSHNKTPGSACELDIKEFKFKYKCADNAIIPAMRPYSKRDDYPIA